MAKLKTKIKDYDVVNDFDRPTPILRGEDAVRFMLEMEKGERSILEVGTISAKDLKKELGIE